MKVIRSVGAPLARNYSRFPSPKAAPVREVMVSQSRDLARNTALEDWAVRNIDPKTKDMLILTNNLSFSPTNETVLDIKATLLHPEAMEEVAQFEELVFSSLPASLPLASLPDLERGRVLLEPGALGHTVRLELAHGVSAKEVVAALDSIGKAFLGEGGIRRLSLVRPEDDWFQGIETIRADIDCTMTTASRQMERRQKEAKKKGSRSPTRGLGLGLKDSFGH